MSFFIQKQVITIIRVLNLNRQTTAILENAYNIGYEKPVNSIWQASFSLPLNDPKVDKVELLQYVEITDDLTGEYIGLFRVMPKSTRKNSESNYVTFNCEHVLATLLDSSLFKYHQRSNFTTVSNLEYLLDKQNHKHWKLGTVEFTRYFHYSWENENLLSALLSIPKPFNEPYIWTWDTQSYPWTLNLVKPETLPTCRIREGYNLQTLEIEENPMSQFNRIYPLGAGEGVNQLTIESVNNGIPYLEDIKPGEEIKEVVWPDQRYTNAESLKADAQALLDKWKVPQVTWSISAADVSSITGLSIDELRLGNVVRLDIVGLPTVDLRIMKESKIDIKGAPGEIQLEIGNVVEDLGTTNADLERRQQINELYSQGATNILNFTYQDNCDEEIPAIIPFYVDDDVVNVNTVELTFETKKYRTYSDVTEDAGQIIRTLTTKGGGQVSNVVTTKNAGQIATSVTSNAGGGTVKALTSSSSGQSSQTSASGGVHRHMVFGYSGAYGSEPDADLYQMFHAPRNRDGSAAGLLLIAGASGDVYTETADGSHTHTFTTPAHTHGVNFELDSHTHDISIEIEGHVHELEIVIDAHVHELEIVIEGHYHEVNHKIIELNRLPTKVMIKVDGNTVPHTAINGDRINLVDYMSKDSSGKITRGKHVVEILPDDLGRIEANLILRVFIQSQLGGNF